MDIMGVKYITTDISKLNQLKIHPNVTSEKERVIMDMSCKIVCPFVSVLLCCLFFLDLRLIVTHLVS